MNLRTLIRDNVDALVIEWQAKTLLDPALGNHNRELLIGIVEDMQTPVSTSVVAARSETVASAHGALRYESGFDLAQVVSEFRALRLSVLSLWDRSSTAAAKASSIDDIARFNEAVDNALSDSIQSYCNNVAGSRDMFLAILGHDLRNPLQSVEAASHVLAKPGLSNAAVLETAMRLRRASRMMNALVTDLLEFTRSRMGRKIPIERSACDVGRVCEEALDSVRSSTPEREFVAHLSGDLIMSADSARLTQVLANLLNNAVQYGNDREPISLRASGEADAILLAIENSGNPIPPNSLRVIFEPLVQLPTRTGDLHRRPKTSVGLGLFIVREIVRGHRGTISVVSTVETGTVFTIRLPREVPSDDGAGAQSETKIQINS
jgi:signal transduction histidine kinase